MKKLLALTLVATNVHALDCGGIPEGQVVRLDQGTGSLAKAAIQDQDGIGSCFANQASLLLQTAIEGHPQLSYLNLGMYYTNDKILKDQKKTSSLNNLYTKNNKEADGTVVEVGSAISGGFPCQTINAALERQKKTGIGSICKAEDVYLEHSFFDPATSSYTDPTFVQERAMWQASKYMNSYQEKFGFSFENADSKALQAKREEADRFALKLREFVKNSSESFMSQKCSQFDPGKTQRILENTLTRAASAHSECLDNKKRFSSPTCTALGQYGFLVVSRGVETKARVEISGGFKKIFNSDFPTLYTKSPDFASFLKNVGSLLKKGDVRAKATPAQKDSLSKEIIAALSPEDKNELESDFKRIALKQIDDCKAENVLEYFKSKKDFIEEAKKDAVLCNYSELLSRASDLAKVMPAQTFRDMSAFVDFITAKAGLNYDEGLMNLMAKDCTPEKRVKIPESLTCTPERVLMEASEFSGDQMSDKVKGIIKENRSKMFDSLSKNLGVGLDICTKFWSDPTYDLHREDSKTKYDSCSKSGKHGFHAITMIGYRCKNNRLEYLAQNSWGPNWKNDNYEIEKGKIWIDEDKLFKNLDNINYIAK